MNPALKRRGLHLASTATQNREGSALASLADASSTMTRYSSSLTEADEPLARKERSHRPRVFSPYMGSCTEPRPLSWESALRRTVSLQRTGVPKPQVYDSILTSHVSRAIRGGSARHIFAQGIAKPGKERYYTS